MMVFRSKNNGNTNTTPIKLTRLLKNLVAGIVAKLGTVGPTVIAVFAAFQSRDNFFAQIGVELHVVAAAGERRRWLS